MPDTSMVPPALSRLLPYPALTALTFVLTLAGILARPIEALSLFWPVNAVLIGVLLRYPRPATFLGFTLMYAAMVSADLAYGSQWLPAVWYNLCNLGAVLTGWAILARVARAHRKLGTPYAVLNLCSASAAAAAVAATLACVSAIAWFDQPLRSTWLDWFSEQFSTAILLMPALLTCPTGRWTRRADTAPVRLMPLALLLASLAVAILVGGPGAIAFPIAALLWCALIYSPFLVALLTLVAGSTLIIAVAQALLHYGYPGREAAVNTLVSARLGIAMLVLGPLVVACVSHANRGLLARLQRQATLDHLTGALSRSAFTERATRLLEERQRHAHASPITLMMLDIDHFKSINDQHGHAAGDCVLRLFAQVLREQLREQDILARLGGEEFVIALPGLSPEQARFTAERLLRTVRAMPVHHAGKQLHITVSIGYDGCAVGEVSPTLDQLLDQADHALYRAKALGRNRTERARQATESIL
ncbi:diguanylate cyclase [Pseudomonas entomophila]|uniref:GGDEF domain-containing protein n=1 Tax=Pseudomonas entomophila TaxID=312306 RepID=UPI0015E36583|nr:GGDEF domain-containing protein [Pseudomonas entomophila]MBA1191017.1 diguanylate cyclase [Pseudomonas entomophila]